MTHPGRFAVLALASAIGLAACGDDSNTPKDAPVDDHGTCGANVFFTGEYVDWDSNETSSFCGVFNAVFTLHGDATVTKKTNPNGRFELCIPPAATAQVDITQDTMPSQCSSAPGTYTIPGIVIANRAVIDTGKLFSARGITMQRVAPFFTQFGLTYDPTKAGVFVHVEGTLHEVSIGAAHGTPLTNDGTTWTAGATGLNVFFPNVDVGSGTTTVTAGGAVGEGTVPVAANTFTYVTLVGK